MSDCDRSADLATGQAHAFRPGVRYALDQGDRYSLAADEDLVTACYINPPVTGTEVHRENGTQAPTDWEDR